MHLTDWSFSDELAIISGLYPSSGEYPVATVSTSQQLTLAGPRHMRKPSSSGVNNEVWLHVYTFSWVVWICFIEHMLCIKRAHSKRSAGCQNKQKQLKNVNICMSILTTDLTTLQTISGIVRNYCKWQRPLWRVHQRLLTVWVICVPRM